MEEIPKPKSEQPRAQYYESHEVDQIIDAMYKEERYVDMPGWHMDEMKKFRRIWLEGKMLVMDKWQGGDNEYIFHAGFGKPFYFTYPTKS